MKDKNISKELWTDVSYDIFLMFVLKSVIFYIKG